MHIGARNAQTWRSAAWFEREIAVGPTQMAPPVPVDVPQVPPHKRKLHFLEYTDSESDGDDDLTAPATLSGEETENAPESAEVQD